MATIGVLVPASPGHLNPMGSLCRELASRGHRVVVAVVPDAEPAILARPAWNVCRSAPRTIRPGTLPRIYAELGKLKGWRRCVTRSSMIAGSTATALREAPDAFRSVGVDLLLVDQASPGGGAIADHLGVPYVHVANALMFNADLNVPPISSTRPYANTTLVEAAKSPDLPDARSGDPADPADRERAARRPGTCPRSPTRTTGTRRSRRWASSRRSLSSLGAASRPTSTTPGRFRTPGPGHPSRSRSRSSTAGRWSMPRWGPCKTGSDGSSGRSPRLATARGSSS